MFGIFEAGRACFWFFLVGHNTFMYCFECFSFCSVDALEQLHKVMHLNMHAMEKDSLGIRSIGPSTANTNVILAPNVNTSSITLNSENLAWRGLRS